MADKENSSRVIRSTMRKRAHDSGPLVARGAAKRPQVVLGELPVCSQANPSSRPQEEPCKPKTQARKKKPSESPKIEEAEKPLGVRDLDLCSDGPQLCPRYAVDIHQYSRSMEAESNSRPLPDFIEVQKDVTPNMRSILVDWLVEVAEDYELLSDTSYLTISYIDRFLSANPINTQRLRLLGISSMLIASKYEEITPPYAEDFCHITDNTYTKKETHTLRHYTGYKPSQLEECVRAMHELQMGRKATSLVAI